MEQALNSLIANLQSSLAALEGEAKDEVMAALHDHDRLPDKQLSTLAAKAVDLLHRTEQLLEPSSFVLADHFLG